MTTQQRSLEITEKRFNARLTNELDVAQAKANVHTTQAEIPALEIGYQQAVNRLSVLLGRPPGYVDEVLEEARPIPSTSTVLAVAIPADLLRCRPSIRGAEREIAAQVARRRAAVAELYPQFTLSGGFSVSAQDLSRLFMRDNIGAKSAEFLEFIGKVGAPLSVDTRLHVRRRDLQNELLHVLSRQ